MSLKTQNMKKLISRELTSGKSSIRNIKTEK